MENDFDIKKDSLLTQQISTDQDIKADKEDETPPPPDKFFFIRITVFLLGLTSMITSMFIMSAYDYWMYKFRDPAMGPVYNLSNKTSLQVNFSAGLGVAMAVPSVVGLAFGVTLGQRFKSRMRIYICYSVVIACYITTTIFVKIDTDTWQAVFFAISMVLLGIMSLIFTTLLTTIIVAVPKLPSLYMKYFLYGQGASGIFSVLMQILCLVIGNDSQTTGLIYFTSGTLLFIFTLFLYYLTQYSPLFTRYVKDEEENTTKMEFPSWAVIKGAVISMWPVLVVQALVILQNSTAHTTITNLIVSENYGDQTPWTQKYFVPVVTIFYADVVGVIGRICSRPNLTPSTAKWHVLFNIVKALVFPPLFLFCNVRVGDRNVEPWFPHDWQYIIILGVFVFTQGYFQTASVLSIPNFAKEGVPMDIYYLILTVILTTCGIGFSPLSVVIVNSL